MTTEIKKNILPPLKILKKISVHIDRKRKKEIKIVFILSLLSSLAESISIAMLIPFISFFINPDSYFFNSIFNLLFKFFDITSQKDVLILISFVFVTVVLISGYIKIKYLKLSNKLSDNIGSDFKIKIFNFLIHQNFDYFFKYGSNEIMSNLSQKTVAFETVVFSTINIINSSLIIIAIMTILIYNEPIYTPIIIFSILIFFYTTYKIHSISILKKGQIVNSNQNTLIDIFQNSIGYLPEIIIYNLRNFFSNILSNVSIEAANARSEIRTISMTPRIYLETFVIILVVFLVNYSGLNERSLSTNISYLAILAFGAQKTLPLINNIYSLSVRFNGSIPTVFNFLKILDRKSKFKIQVKNFKPITFKNEILIDNISFKYDQNLPNIFDNLSFKINKGEKVAIKGETGSGKSTLINLITGLFIPTRGKILIDGIIIENENIQGWQKNIAIVPQVIFLNNATILENIAIAEPKESINLDKAKNSARVAQIDSFINSLPNNYYQKVGERGIRLSGGQRQRIGIARALYRDANLLVLDEPTNSLDAETEKLFMDSITTLSKKITLIMVSHSNTSLKYFDKIIDLDKFK